MQKFKGSKDNFPPKGDYAGKANVKRTSLPKGGAPRKGKKK